MKEYFIRDLVSKIGEHVSICGWVFKIRNHKKVVFVDLQDRSGVLQVVGDERFATLSPEDVVCIKGTIKKRPEKLVNPRINTGEIELEAQGFDLIEKSDTLPFDMGKEELDVTLPTLLDYRGLTLRHPKIRAIFEVQETVIDAFRKGMKLKRFTEFQSPVIIPVAAEGGADIFEVKYFDHKAYLSQSPQFYKQIMVGVFERVFTVNKTLRAEPSVTTRHLSEVTTLDTELGFIDDWSEIMDTAEYIIRHINDAVLTQNKEVLDLYHARPLKIPDRIPRLKLKHAQEIIFKRTGRDVRSEPDLSPEDEREIGRYAKETYASELVFITHYPASKRPFYTFEDGEDPGYTLSFDLIGRGVEWCTGGRRITHLADLLKKAKDRGINIEKSELYLQAFRYGMPPEGGFAFGSERIVMGILGLANIREASLFPRDMERVDIRL